MDVLLGCSSPSPSLSATRSFLWALSILKGTQQERPSSQLTLPQAGLEPWLPHILLVAVQPDAVLCEVLADGGSCDGF